MADNTTIRLTIDGQEVEAEKGQMLLDVACKNGIKIPTLCHHKSLGGYGACRLCVAEVTKRDRTKLTASCTYPVQDGVSVETNTEDLIKIRRLIIESMLARAPNSPEIKELAEELGVESTRFKLNPDEDNKCILCGLCVRICNEKMKIGAIGFANRGADRMITPPFEDFSDVCSTCGACSVVCPTGAIDIKLFSEKPLLSIPFEFNEGLESRTPVYIPFPQAVPKIPVIDKTSCMYYLNRTSQSCSDFCEPGAIEFDQEDTVLDIDVGAIVVATGFDLFDATNKPEYSYGTSKRIMTGIEFERLVSASGPTEGHIEINGKEPKRVAFIQCVGSRDRQGHEYCSRVCCMYTAKHAHLVRDKIPGSDLTVYYTDVRAFGKGFEEFYVRVQGEGVNYRKRELEDPIEVVPNKDGETITIKANGHPDLEVDLVVLATAIEPRKDALDMMRTLNIGASGDGFMLEAHPKLRPLDTFTDGIFLAGCCQAPKDIPDTVAQASGAAAMACNILSKDTMEIDPLISSVNEVLCRGCGFCVEVCPYDAIGLESVNQFVHMADVARVNEALCKGCGSCAGACLSGAIQVKGYNDQQIHAAISVLGGSS